MVDRLGAWPALFIFMLLCAVVVATAFIFASLWITIPLVAIVLVTAIVLARDYLIKAEKIAVLSSIVPTGDRRDNPIAHRLLVEITLAASERRPMPAAVQEVIRENLKVDNFVIFLREDDRFTPKIIAGLNRNSLATPPVHRLSSSLKHGMSDGSVSTAENDIRLAYRNEEADRMVAPMAFAYSWGRGRAVLMIADDPRGDLAELVRDTGFNRVFWPGLDYIVRASQKLYERAAESRQASQQLARARKDLVELERELKSKMVDIQSFVTVSHELYSHVSEEQLFRALTAVVRDRLQTTVAEILTPAADGRFTIYPAAPGERPQPELVLEGGSEICELIAQSPRPVSLPLAASGMRRDEPFLNAAIGAGIAAATVIRAGGQTACVLLAGEKGDKTQYSSQDMDFLFVVSNIASLALDNIYQYTTIEKLSYTDSMTGVFNYRYFYKRLNEEILRARRYDRELALVILDIDNFKSFNDNFGHQAGDLILKQLSDLITRTIRSIDVLSRYGGEEFCIIMPDTGIGNCTVFIERLRSQIAESQFESDFFPKGSSISISVGGAVYPQHASTPDRLIYSADMALLKAKSLGRNRAIMFEPDLTTDAHPTEGGYNESHQQTTF